MGAVLGLLILRVLHHSYSRLAERIVGGRNQEDKSRRLSQRKSKRRGVQGKEDKIRQGGGGEEESGTGQMC